MRCPDCNKFVSFDTDEDPEIQSEEMNGTVAEVEVRITNNCADCGQEMKEASFNLEHDFKDEIFEHQEENAQCMGAAIDLDVSLSRTERRQTKDRNGKPIKSSRYQKQFYGVDGTFTISCGTCQQEIASAQVEDETQASGMDELV